jgi:hypothetical protein
MKATDGSLRIGESGRKWPDWGKKITQGNISALPEIADVLVAQNSRMGPGKQVAPWDCDGPISAWVNPWADGRAMQRGEMGSAADESAKIARERANVISATYR